MSNQQMKDQLRRNSAAHPDVIEPGKHATLNILASKQPPFRAYINYLNKQEGLPLLSPGEHGCLGTAHARLREYAENRGWIGRKQEHPHPHPKN